MPIEMLPLTSYSLPTDARIRSSDEPQHGQGLPSRLQHLGLLLWVSLSMPIAGSVYYLLGGTAPTAPIQQQFRLVGALITQVTSLLVLWYVMCTQRRSWNEIGWNPEIRDIPRGLGLLVISNLAMYVLFIPIQYTYRVYAGHFLVPKSLNTILGFGISSLSIAFVCLNPFFEELIVRAYTISEVINLGASRTMAVVVSVAVQMSYHLYQGFVSAVALTFVFTMFSIYYVRTRRIGPVILAHLCVDVLALIRGVF
jgi:membrane protease YdiL (CAAX protease family)